MGQTRHIGVFLTLFAIVYFLGFSSLLVNVHEIRHEQVTREMDVVIPSFIRNVTHDVYINRSVIVYREWNVTRYGPGEFGEKVEIDQNLLSFDTRNKTATFKKFHGFDTFVSDLIGYHRRPPDLRQQECKDIVYPADLPPVSVVIIFRDEWPSIIMRTAYGVLETSPYHLVHEVILVDDGSVDEHVITQIDLHVNLVEKFRLVRNPKPLGLMMARQVGIEAATADYFVVLDGHMEPLPGWLEPLVYRLVQKPNALLCSHIAVINSETFKIDADNRLCDALFPFYDPLTLDQQWVSFRESYKAKRASKVEPIEYGTIQGMMAVMRKDFFMQLGGFDPGMKVWGTEQMELSFKVWLCGGVIEMVPCSKVGHMYRITPWSKVNQSSDFGAANKRRTADVWMDEASRQFIMDNIRNAKYDYGNLDDRHKIRIENNCKPFQYFLDKVNEISDAFMPRSAQIKGRLYNRLRRSCLDLASRPNKTGEYDPIMYPCHGTHNQFFILTDESQIRAAPSLILLVKNPDQSLHVRKSPENVYDDDTRWEYRGDHSVAHMTSGKCLTIVSGDKVELEDCVGSERQIWEWNMEDS